MKSGMKILVVGGGGREHAIVWKLAQSKYKPQLYCAPGNAGISNLAECVSIKTTDFDGIVKFSLSNQIDLVFVAPDDPLASGLVNLLVSNGIRTFGPTAEAAIIEASKSFSKDLMLKYGIPTAKYKTFTDIESAHEYIDSLTAPIVIKADGLALGKGVIIAQTRDEAKDAVDEMQSGRAFGASGKTVLIEEFLTGRELTVLAFTDGKSIVAMPNSRDHKKAFDGNCGPNTGGMGAICPGEGLSAEYEKMLEDTIFYPTINAMKAEGREFKGVIYFGLMITDTGPKVIEYNARFGDPETQAVLPLLKTDFVDVINAVIDSNLNELKVEWGSGASCCVVISSGGYPGTYTTGYEITGLESVDCLCFHAGTKIDVASKKIVTSGGRVLGLTALSDNIDGAISKAYTNVSKIAFKDMHYRKDIGKS